MRRLEATGTYTDDEINRLARKGKQRGYIHGVGRVLPARATASPSMPAHESTLNSLYKKLDFMMSLFKSDSKYSDMFSQFESGGASGSGRCRDDEEGADDQDDEDEDGDGDTYDISPRNVHTCIDSSTHKEAFLGDMSFPGDMSPGNMCHRCTNFLTGKYVGPTVSLEIVVGEGIPYERSPTNIPQRQVTGETYPQRQVTGESPELSLGNGLNVVVGVDVFNHFFSNAGLEEVLLEGFSFTWCHRSATKMSKLDRFRISDSLLCSCPNISSITLDWYLSDHRPILMREDKSHKSKRILLAELANCDAIIDKGEGENNVVNRRTEVVNLIQEVEKKNSLEAAEKLSICGILVEGTWIDSPSLVKSEFPSHFKNQFEQLNSNQLHLNMHVSNTLSSVQVAELEYTVTCFFHQGSFPKGGNSSFIMLIPKTPNVSMVKDYMPISLIGIMYKIISKILENRLVVVLGGLVNKIQSAFVADKQILHGPFILNELVQWCKKKKKQSLVFKVDFEKAYDSVRWDHLDDIMRKFGFGEKWFMWIQRCLWSSRGSVIVNRMDVGFFKGIELAPFLSLSHMFYADDAIFMGQWSESNIDTSVKVLDCFNRASGLRINMTKSKLLGISVKDDKVKQAAAKIGCITLKTPFFYLGSKVGGCMSRIQSWNETIERMACRLSKSKLKTLLIGGKLNLLKSVLGSMPIYHMSLFKVPKKVLHRSGEFTITSVRKMIDDFMLPEVSSKTRWIKSVPIKELGLYGDTEVVYDSTQNCLRKTLCVTKSKWKSTQNMSSNAEGTYSESKVRPSDDGSQASWDVHTLSGHYVSTDFVMSDEKGNAIHSSTKANVAHNFLKLKEGLVYCLKHFVVQSNKEEYCIFRDHTYMIELDGATSVRKASVRVVDLSDIRSSLFCLMLLDTLQIKDVESLSQGAVHADYSQAKEGTLENLLIWAKNRKNDKGVMRKNESFWCQACEKAVDYPVLRFRLELDVSDKAASTVVVMFDEPAKDMLKCSADSLAAADDESGFGYADHAGLPLALANIIGTTHTLEMKSHTYYEHGTFDSFTCWRIAPEEVVDVDSDSSNINTSADVNITKVKRLPTNPSVETPSKPTEERVKKELEDSDDEVTGDMDDGGKNGKESSLADKKKKKRYIMDDCDSAEGSDNASIPIHCYSPKGRPPLPNNTTRGKKRKALASTATQPFNASQLSGTVTSTSADPFNTSKVSRADHPRTRASAKAPKRAAFTSASKVLLLKFKDTPTPLDKLLNFNDPRTSKFRDQIRVYNGMFCFTSFGARIDYSINTRRGLYTFRINGQNYHRIGSLLPALGFQPRYAQFYFFEIDNEVRNRMLAFLDTKTGQGVDLTIVAGLMDMLDQKNAVAQSFRMARDWCHSHESVNFELRLLNIVVDNKDEGPKRVSELHPSCMALQYPVLFPYGEDGYHEKIPYHTNRGTRKTKRGFVTMKEYYAYIIQQRNDQGNTLLRGERLYQKFLVDAFTDQENSLMLKSHSTIGGIKMKRSRNPENKKSIGRIYYSNPAAGDRYYLRMLLNVARGPQGFKELMTVNKKWYPTFKAVCFAYGLLNDEKEWAHTINEASFWALASQLHDLFVIMLLFCDVSRPLRLWEETWELLSQDILLKKRKLYKYPNLQLKEEQIKNYYLVEIEALLNRNGRSLTDFQELPRPKLALLTKLDNRLI
nr:RNA-directed DNA polymerase, eukaryota [Tanacetum cinerariifolium]